MAGKVLSLFERLRQRREAISSGDPTGDVNVRNAEEVRKEVDARRKKKVKGK